jgi:hypothetical protein
MLNNYDNYDFFEKLNVGDEFWVIVEWNPETGFEPKEPQKIKVVSIVDGTKEYEQLFIFDEEDVWIKWIGDGLLSICPSITNHCFLDEFSAWVGYINLLQTKQISLANSLGRATRQLMVLMRK